MNQGLKEWIKFAQEDVEKALLKQLPLITTQPTTIHKAMHYSVFAGGKRLRALLCIAAAEACGSDQNNALFPACALETLHTYSLIHDDLPCMDDDILRRGKPTNHVIFGEGIAVLAGDALLTEAFAILLRTEEVAPYKSRDFFKVLSDASGSQGMIGGQTLDIEAEGKIISSEELKQIHALKTAALLQAALILGGMSAGASKQQIDALGNFGKSLGLAYQVIDDILDLTRSSSELGKTAGKDEKVMKATYPSILGLEEAKSEADTLTRQALESLGVFGEKGSRLKEIADYMLLRKF